MNKNIFLVSSPSQKKTAWLHSKLSFQRIFPPNLGSLSWWTPSFSKISLRLDHSLHFDLSDGWDRRWDRWDRWENSASDVGDPEDSLPRWNRCVTSNFWGLFFENMPPESIRYMIRWSSLTLWHTCQCCPQRTNKKKTLCWEPSSSGILRHQVPTCSGWPLLVLRPRWGWNGWSRWSRTSRDCYESSWIWRTRWPFGLEPREVLSCCRRQNSLYFLFDPWTHVFNVGSPFDVFCMFNFGLKQDTLPPEDCSI